MSNINPNSFFIGVDGGATKCIVRLEDASGKLLGEEINGAANIRISVEEAWQAIYAGLNKILAKSGISLTDKNKEFFAGMGLAGCEVKEAYAAFNQKPHPFKKLMVTSDSHAACLGAHRGDGAIIIAGTGVVGFQIEAGETEKVGGFGFPHDDKGGGAWLGLEAIRATLYWLDKRIEKSSLAEAIFTHFNKDLDQLVFWAHQATSTQFATLAPFVIEHCQKKDPIALRLRKEAAESINLVSETLIKLQKNPTVLPCTLVGGITTFLEPFLNQELRARLCHAYTTPASGAIRLIRERLREKYE